MMMTHAKCLWHKSRREGLVRDPFDRHGMPLKPLVLLASLSLTMTAAHWLNVYYIKKLHIYYSYTVFSIHSVAQLHIVYPFQVMSSTGQENYVRNRSDCLTITQKGEKSRICIFCRKRRTSQIRLELQWYQHRTTIGWQAYRPPGATGGSTKTTPITRAIQACPYNNRKWMTFKCDR